MAVTEAMEMSDTIKTSDLDKAFRDEVLTEPGAEKLILCFNCTGCTAGCPMAEHEPNYNIRQLLRMANLGMRDELLNHPYLWNCTTCYKCQERCPQGVPNVDILLKIRTIAVHNGIMLDNHRKVAQLMAKTGHAVPINDDSKEKRKTLGLNELPETVHNYPDALEEVHKIIAKTKFDKLTEDKT
jgi:heterodisulfide reductase subunit C